VTAYTFRHSFATHLIAALSLACFGFAMYNLHLNAGGVICGLLCPVVAFIALFNARTWLFSTPQSQEEIVPKLIVGAAIGGALLGNWIWAMLFPNRSSRDNESGPR
jgi:polyferredoxin